MKAATLALLTLLALLHSATYVYAISDDAFISLRYGANLVDGAGLVYNPGETPVEGFSNPLFTVVSALLLALGIPPVWALRVLGLGAIAASMWLLPRLVRAMAPEASSFVQLAAPALFAASSLPCFAAMTGLETALHASLVLLATTLSVKEVGDGRVGLGPIAWLAVAASRPEGALLALFVAATQADALALDRRVFLRWTIGFAIPASLLLAGRFLYYDAWVPNTYYAKVHFDANALGSGLDYLRGFALGAGGWVALPALAGFGLALRRYEVRLVVLPIAAVLAQAGYALFVGGDFMPGHRFLMPIYPLLCAGAAFVFAWRPIEGVRGLRNVVAAALLVVLCLGAGWHQREALRTSPLRFWLLHSEPWWSYFGHAQLAGTWLGAHRETARYLSENSRPGDQLVVTEAGVVPYHAALETIDLFGLNHREIAAAWRSTRSRQTQGGGNIALRLPQIAFASNPRWIVLDGFEDARGFHPRTLPARLIARAPEFRHYEPVFRARVYSAEQAGRSNDRVNFVFERRRPTDP